MKTKTICRPADPRFTIEEILNPIYMSIDLLHDAYYIPDGYRSRIIVVEFVEEETKDGK